MTPKTINNDILKLVELVNKKWEDLALNWCDAILNE